MYNKKESWATQVLRLFSMVHHLAENFQHLFKPGGFSYIVVLVLMNQHVSHSRSINGGACWWICWLNSAKTWQRDFACTCSCMETLSQHDNWWGECNGLAEVCTSMLLTSFIKCGSMLVFYSKVYCSCPCLVIKMWRSWNASLSL